MIESTPTTTSSASTPAMVACTPDSSKPNSKALDKLITNRLDDRNMLGRKLTDMERSRAALAIKSLYIGYTLGFKEATFNHYEDLSRKSQDESIEAAVNAGNRILEKKK